MDNTPIETATYSPEDDKIRLYPLTRLAQEDYDKLKARKFKWAPKQELFVAHWSPGREDLALEMSGQDELEPEETTLADRAEAKAERLAGYAEKRAEDSRSLSSYAHSISERFAFGQPILVGHHSERKARKDAEKMDNAMRRAAESFKKAEHWQWKAASIIRHANHLQRPETRARRIKTLMAEMRKIQKRLNFAAKALDLWERIKSEQNAELREKLVNRYAGGFSNEGSMNSDWHISDKLRKEEMTADEVIADGMSYQQRIISSPTSLRWIAHLYNRMVYERELLGPVARYEGPIKATTLQIFMREMGADKPKASKTDAGWIVKTAAPLPLILPIEENGAQSLEMSEDAWRDLMEAAGHHVEHASPTKTAKAKKPLLNYRPASGKIETTNRYHRGETKTLPVVEITKAEYAKIHTDYKATEDVISDTPHRFRSAMRNAIPGMHGDGYGLVAVYLTDSKDHGEPEKAPEPEPKKPTPSFGAYANHQPTLF